MVVTRRTKHAAAAATLALGGIWGWCWATTSIHSYDQRYADCMHAQGAYSFPSDAYDQAARQCEKVAAP